jgi:hypothetical protein
MTAFDDLLAAQELDTAIDQLRHRLDALPERDRQAKAHATLDALAVRRADAEARRDEVRREQRRHEDEVSSIEEKVAKVDAQLYGSGITSPKEAEAFQADLESLKRRQRNLEDLVIEQMELAEPIDAELDSLAADAAVASVELADATAALDDVAGHLTGDLADLESQQSAVRAAVPEDLLATYDSMRPRLGGVAVARLVSNRCEGCHLLIPSAEAEGLRRSPADALITCPECTRILVR